MTRCLTIPFLVLFHTALFGQQTETLYLSGHGFDDPVSWEFFCTAGRNSGKWTTIAVPSCWEQQGFGEYNYGHVPFDQRLKEEGHYRYRFMAEKGWKDQHVLLVFEGVMTDCRVLLNGKQAGEVHRGAFYPFSYDVSGLLRYGKENLLEVFVKKHSDNMSVNQAERKADYWIFGGIFRPVCLEIRPREHIKRVAIDARADGTFRSDVTVTSGKRVHTVSVEILDDQGIEIARFSSEISGNGDKVRLSGQVEDPRSWSPEFPHLYSALFKLVDGNGEVIHRVPERIGFRTVEVREQDGIYVNGVRIRYKGVNRHSFHPDHGRTSSRQYSIEAVNLIKDMNMNAVRMSHYPPDEHFLDVCDSLGLFVLDELAGWQRPPYDSAVGRRLLPEMIARDVNHPCVVMWDNGNEGGWNTAYDEDFMELDIQNREVNHPWAAFRKTNTAHYVNYDYLSLDHFAPRSVFFPTELLHGLYDGGHGAGLEDFWLRMWTHPLCAGGFLWVFADEAVKRTDTGELDSDGNHAPDGILGPYHEKEGSFYSIREIWSPVHIEKRYLTPGFNGVFNIENRYHYTSLDRCSFSCRWMRLQGPGETGPPDQGASGDPGPDEILTGEILAEGSPEVEPLRPGQRGTLKVDLPEQWQKADVLYLEASDPHGRLIHQWRWPVHGPKTISDSLLGNRTTEGKVRTEETEDRLIAEAGGIRMMFSKRTGLLEDVITPEGKIPLSGGLPLSGDLSGQAGLAGADEALLSGGDLTEDGPSAVLVMNSYTDDGSLRLRFDFEGESHIQWILHPDGLLDMKARYHMNGGGGTWAGVLFSFPEDQCSSVRYLGNGPYRVWKNRLAGVNFGVWDKTYNNTIVGYSGYEYPAFRGYYSNLYWASFRGPSDRAFTVYCHTNDIFLRLFTPGEPPDPAHTRVQHPPGDISFLHGIPAIGTKFKNADQLGPGSRPYQYLPRRIRQGALTLHLTFDFTPSNPAQK